MVDRSWYGTDGSDGALLSYRFADGYDVEFVPLGVYPADYPEWILDKARDLAASIRMYDAQSENGGLTFGPHRDPRRYQMYPYV